MASRGSETPFMAFSELATEKGLKGYRLLTDAWAEELNLGEWYAWVRHV